MDSRVLRLCVLACRDAALFVCCLCVKDSCSFCSSAGPPARTASRAPSRTPSSLSKRCFLQATVGEGPPSLPSPRPSQQAETSAAEVDPGSLPGQQPGIFLFFFWERFGPVWVKAEAGLAPNVFSSVPTMERTQKGCPGGSGLHSAPLTLMNATTFTHKDHRSSL